LVTALSAINFVEILDIVLPFVLLGTEGIHPQLQPFGWCGKTGRSLSPPFNYYTY